MLLYIVRHGDPIYDPDSLTPLGLRQAEAVGRRLATYGMNRIFASSNIRAQLTAKPLAEILHSKVEIEPWTTEDTAFGEFSKMYNGKREWAFWHDRVATGGEDGFLETDCWYDSPVFDGTNAKAGYQRVANASDGFLAKLGFVRDGRRYRVDAHENHRVAVFCHEGFGSIWCSHLLHIHPTDFWAHYAMTHSGVSVIEFGEDSEYTVPVCLCYSDMSHILKADLPMKHRNITLI